MRDVSQVLTADRIVFASLAGGARRDRAYGRKEISQWAPYFIEYEVGDERVRAVKVEGSFAVEGQDGVTVVCGDGFLVVREDGWPYPVPASEFRARYTAVESEPEAA